MASLTSDELNYLVFRYLSESDFNRCIRWDVPIGFVHTAYNLGYEAGVYKHKLDGHIVPYGALIKFVQKGFQYLEMEANLSSSNAEEEEDFSFIQPLDLITKDVSELQQMVRERKRKDRDRDENRLLGTYLGILGEGERSRVIRKPRSERLRVRERQREKMEQEKEREREKTKYRMDREMAIDRSDKDNAGDAGHGASKDLSHFFMILQGHNSEVCACAWSPTASLLASGSGDATARIWTIPEGTSRSGLHTGPLSVFVLKQIKGVTALDWNVEGTLLATGSSEGQARIWTTNGELKSTLSMHKGPIFSLKWNKKGNYLLTGGDDKSAIVWDVKAEQWKQRFLFHTGKTLDVDWRNNVSFATSSADSMIYICTIGQEKPVKTFAGHKDPTGSLLASCSDDSTAKIWSVKQDDFVHDLREHTMGIYTIRWSPTGPGTNNPNRQLILASASYDSTVKLWDVERGKMICSLNGHRGAVYSVGFSPDGEYVASGSLDRSVNVWSVKEGKMVKTYSGKSAIFDVSWDKDGNKIAAAFSDNDLCVLDFRM